MCLDLERHQNHQIGATSAQTLNQQKQEEQSVWDEQELGEVTTGGMKKARGFNTGFL